MEITYFIIAIVLMLPGILGVFLPIVPGIPYMYAVVLVYGLITKFQTLGTGEMILLAVITLLSIFSDYLSGLLGARWGGAHKKSILSGLIGLIIGTIVLPPFGGVIGLFLGVFIAEILIHDDHKKAVRAATGSIIGSLAGILISAILSILFILLFIIFAVK